MADICAKLEKDAIAAAPSPPGELDSDDTLAYIEDPVAVPYLARLLDEKAWASTTYALGLGRIGDGPAVEALISHLSSVSDAEKPIVRAVLSGVEGRTSDPQIRERIKAALR